MQTAAKYDLSPLHDIDAIGVVRDVLQFGLGDQYGASEFDNLMNRVPDSWDNRRRQSFKWLVQEQQIGVEGKRPGNRQHFPFAPGQMRSWPSFITAQSRKHP